MPEREVAEIFHPGSFVREEMEARGWSIETLTEKSGINKDFLEELIAEHRNLTPVIAYMLGKAFGTSKQFWMNLQLSWKHRQSQ